MWKLEQQDKIYGIYFCSHVDPFSEAWKNILSCDLTLIYPNVTCVYIDELRFLALYSHFLTPMFNFWFHRNKHLTLFIFNDKHAENDLEKAALDILEGTKSVEKVLTLSRTPCSNICKRSNSITILPDGSLVICERFFENTPQNRPNFGKVDNPHKHALEKWFDFCSALDFSLRYSCAGDVLRLLLPKVFRDDLLNIWCPYLAYKWAGSLFTPNFIATEAIAE